MNTIIVSRVIFGLYREISNMLSESNIFTKLMSTLLIVLVFLWIFLADEMSPYWRNVVSIAYGIVGVLAGIFVLGIIFTLIFIISVFVLQVIREIFCDNKYVNIWGRVNRHKQNVTMLQETFVLIGSVLLLICILVGK